MPPSLLTTVATVSLFVVAVVIAFFGQSPPLVIRKHFVLDVSSGRDGVSSLRSANGCPSEVFAQSNNGATFLFVVGLEGVGHHLHATIFKGSPFWKQLEENRILLALKEAGQLLYGDGGLMSLHCLDQLSGNVSVSNHSAVTKCPRSDSVCLHNETVKLLRSISSQVGNESLIVPMNANGNGETMASYPNNKHPCRSLEYPNLDFFYDACKEADVKCGHLHLYRDPIDVLKSSMKRHFNADPAQAMQLYTTMLDVIFSQFARHSSSNFGCFDFFDKNLSQEEKWGPLGALLGWSNQTEFLEFIGKVYRRPTQASEENRTFLVPEMETRYLMAFIQASDDVLELCRRTVASRMISQSPRGC